MHVWLSHPTALPIHLKSFHNSHKSICIPIKPKVALRGWHSGPQEALTVDMCLAQFLDVLTVAERVQGSALELVGGVVQEVGHSGGEGEGRRG